MLLSLEGKKQKKKKNEMENGKGRERLWFFCEHILGA